MQPTAFIIPTRSPIASAARAAWRGFTLIEMLIVIVIIGVIVSMATLSVNMLGRDSQVEDQTRRFWAVLQQAREEAELQSINVGVFVSDRRTSTCASTSDATRGCRSWMTSCTAT